MKIKTKILVVANIFYLFVCFFTIGVNWEIGIRIIIGVLCFNFISNNIIEILYNEKRKLVERCLSDLNNDLEILKQEKEKLNKFMKGDINDDSGIRDN